MSGSEQAIHITQRVVFNGWRNYKLAVGGSLHQAPNGDLLCFWLSGSNGEPAADNGMLLARSTDAGRTWSEPTEWVCAGDEAAAVKLMHTTDDGRLIAFGNWWPYEKSYTVQRYFRIESKDAGRTWSEPWPFQVRESQNISLAGPVTQLDNGDYIFPTTFFEKRRTPLTGAPEALALAEDETAAASLPPAPPGHEAPEKFGTHLYGCSVFIASEDDLSDMQEHGQISNRPLGLLEPSLIQLKDGRIVMLMRAEWGGFLWRTESHDAGRTWTKARETDIPNPSNKARLARLADGRIALIHNASGGQRGRRGPRSPLSIWISDDEMDTWNLKVDIATRTPLPSGQWRAGPDMLSYPCPLVLGGKLFFGYDRNRREVVFAECNIG
ncbi:MAG: glycoside hydrolase [Candidatus Pacebacteria bacterium]|nr:glycoside hydrolase [Candidatus Paceibacterota bacterium]